MSNYIFFTPEQRNQARNTDLAAFLESRGETLKRSGSEVQWGDGPEKVTIRGNLWYHQYDQVGGDAIDFMRKFFNQDYKGAMSMLLGQALPTVEPSRAAPRSAPQQPKAVGAGALQLPPRNRQIRRIFGYLCGRGISCSVVSEFVARKMLYESAEYHNAVFVGFDPQGRPAHAHLRGSTRQSQFKSNATGSDPRYSFHYHGKDNTIFLFEAPVDMLSYITMLGNGWQEHSYAASCGVSDQVLEQMLQENPRLDTVFLCRDNDTKGQQANQRTIQALAGRGIQCFVMVPTLKDWNMDLMAQREQQSTAQEQEDGPCPEQSL